jgi:23S rRNA (pseudouridine1915-N3)-methyltransferase
MKVRLLVIGETDQKEVKYIVNQYFEKINRYIDFEINVLKDPGKGLKLGAEDLKQKEGKLIIANLSKGEKVILLDENGLEFTSVQFSSKIMGHEMAISTKQLTFVIGGPFGFSEETKKLSQGKISLSKMTFTHQLVRVIFLEQLYRSLTIIKGEKYHHE